MVNNFGRTHIVKNLTAIFSKLLEGAWIKDKKRSFAYCNQFKLVSVPSSLFQISILKFVPHSKQLDNKIWISYFLICSKNCLTSVAGCRRTSFTSLPGSVTNTCRKRETTLNLKSLLSGIEGKQLFVTFSHKKGKILQVTSIGMVIGKLWGQK